MLRTGVITNRFEIPGNIPFYRIQRFSIQERLCLLAVERSEDRFHTAMI